MAILERANDVTERQMEEVSKNISAMKATMFSAGESDTAREAATVLAYEVRSPLGSRHPGYHGHHSIAHRATRLPKPCQPRA